MAYLDQFLQTVVQQEASDLHIAEGDWTHVSAWLRRELSGDAARAPPA